jgi:hypothetical protein
MRVYPLGDQIIIVQDVEDALVTVFRADVVDFVDAVRLAADGAF